MSHGPFIPVSQPIRPTAASDVWALGVILWEVAYLNHPFFTTQKEWWQVLIRRKQPEARNDMLAV